jgi:hypothetical protein
MRRAVLASILAALFALTALVGPALAVPPTAPTWHRLNPFTDSGLAEHEQLHCLTNRQWVCRYDKAPEPGLNWDRTIGMFHGRVVDLATWDCPEWLEGVCEEAAMVVAGKINFANADGFAFQVRNELIFTSGDGVAPLYVHWPDFGFACAWYESFDDAVAADPAMEGNCLLAP